MTIVPRKQVRETVAAALLAGATTEQAIAEAAAELALPPEAITECLDQVQEHAFAA